MSCRTDVHDDGHGNVSLLEVYGERVVSHCGYVHCVGDANDDFESDDAREGMPCGVHTMYCVSHDPLDHQKTRDAPHSAFDGGAHGEGSYEGSYESCPPMASKRRLKDAFVRLDPPVRLGEL